MGAAPREAPALVDGPSLPVTRLDPRTPYYFLVPHDRSGEREYARGYRLPDIMPVNSTVAVTARDSFVVAFSEAELEARIAVLGDSHVSDDEIRRRYFTSGRSTKYPPGDTRGWRLAEARQRVAREPDWRRWIRDCLYRPFDRRKIFWAPWMIDWPRPAVMTHLAAGTKRGLGGATARTGVPAVQLLLDHRHDRPRRSGAIRQSRQRIGVSTLPRRRFQPRGPMTSRSDRRRLCESAAQSRPNFSADFVDRFVRNST